MKVDYRLEKEGRVIPPRGGWKEHTYYLVEVSYRPTNAVHLAILDVGFLGKNSEPGIPGNYSEIWNNTYDQAYVFSSVHYLKVMRKLVTITK